MSINKFKIVRSHLRNVDLFSHLFQLIRLKMRTKKDLDLLILTLQYGRYCLPIKWDSAKGRIATKSPRQQKCVILTLVVHFLITICRLYSISLHKSVMDRAEPALIAVSYTISFLVRLDVPVDFSVVQLINFISLGNNSHNGKLTKIQYGKIFLRPREFF